MALLKSPERNWLAAGFGSLMLLLGLSSLMSYQNSAQLIESSYKSQRTYEVMKNLDHVFAAITIAESARRGYIYLGNQTELERYHSAVEEIPPKLQELRQQFVNDANNLEKLNKLDFLLKQRLELLKTSIAIYHQKNSAVMAQAIITNNSIALRGEIQSIIGELQQNEETELQRSIQNSQMRIRDRKLIELWLMISGFGAITICFAALYSQLAKRQQAEAIQHKLAQQKELSELKLRFFSMVSHEFRTPLSIILGSAQLLESSPTWSEERKVKNLQRIQSSAKVMKSLLTDILTLTRAEAGKLDCKPEWVDLESFCLNLVEDFEFSRADHCIQFYSQCSYSHAYLDERLLYSVLSNLLSNAIKYSPAESKIQLNLIGTANTVVFEVKDEGMGISQEAQHHLYEPFYRGEHSTQIAGTGLGLAVVKKCVNLLQGNILVESQPNAGTTFTVKLPRRCECRTSA